MTFELNRFLQSKFFSPHAIGNGIAINLVFNGGFGNGDEMAMYEVFFFRHRTSYLS